MTAFRETFYTAGYLGICPVLKEHLQNLPALEGYPSGIPSVLAGTSAGLLAAVVTQPSDTIKTRMQVGN